MGKSIVVNPQTGLNQTNIIYKSLSDAFNEYPSYAENQLISIIDDSSVTPLLFQKKSSQLRRVNDTGSFVAKALRGVTLQNNTDENLILETNIPIGVLNNFGLVQTQLTFTPTFLNTGATRTLRIYVNDTLIQAGGINPSVSSSATAAIQTLTSAALVFKNVVGNVNNAYTSSGVTMTNYSIDLDSPVNIKMTFQTNNASDVDIFVQSSFILLNR